MSSYCAIGACYIIRQAPGVERLGGLQVKLWPSEGGGGAISIRPTAWRTGEDLGALVSDYAEDAMRGIREVAEAYGIRLGDFDLELSEFLYHDVDSFSLLYYQAGKSAFRSALEMWRTRDLSSEIA